MYRILETPWVYTLSQMLFAPGAKELLAKAYAEIFRGSRGPVLDVGCGPKLTTPPPETGIIVGVDVNEAYVDAYSDNGVDDDPKIIRDYQGNRKQFGFAGSADQIPFPDALFTECRCMGVLHHLPDNIAETGIREMMRCTAGGGKVIIIDNVIPRNAFFRPIAWFTRKMDRGKWVRKEEKLRKMVQLVSGKEWNCQRFTYTFTGLECVALTLEKSESDES